MINNIAMQIVLYGMIEHLRHVLSVNVLIWDDAMPILNTWIVNEGGHNEQHCYEVKKKWLRDDEDNISFVTQQIIATMYAAIDAAYVEDTTIHKNMKAFLHRELVNRFAQ